MLVDVTGLSFVGPVVRQNQIAAVDPEIEARQDHLCWLRSSSRFDRSR
jgi:hypothetical protein